MTRRRPRSWLVIDNIERQGSPGEPSLIAPDTSVIRPHARSVLGIIIAAAGRGASTAVASVT